MWTLLLRYEDDQYYYFGFSREENVSCDSEVIVRKSDEVIVETNLAEGFKIRWAEMCAVMAVDLIEKLKDGKPHTIFTH